MTALLSVTSVFLRLFRRMASSSIAFTKALYISWFLSSRGCSFSGPATEPDDNDNDNENCATPATHTDSKSIADQCAWRSKMVFDGVRVPLPVTTNFYSGSLVLIALGGLGSTSQLPSPPRWKIYIYSLGRFAGGQFLFQKGTKLVSIDFTTLSTQIRCI